MIWHTRLNSFGSTPALCASVAARRSARNMASGLRVSDSRPVQMALNEIRVPAEHGKSVRVAGRAATGTKGWGAPPVADWAGKDFTVDGASIFRCQVNTAMIGFVPCAERARCDLAAVAALDAGPGTGFERERRGIEEHGAHALHRGR